MRPFRYWAKPPKVSQTLAIQYNPRLRVLRMVRLTLRIIRNFERGVEFQGQATLEFGPGESLQLELGRNLRGNNLQHQVPYCTPGSHCRSFSETTPTPQRSTPWLRIAIISLLLGDEMVTIMGM